MNSVDHESENSMTTRPVYLGFTLLRYRYEPEQKSTM